MSDEEGGSENEEVSGEGEEETPESESVAKTSGEEKDVSQSTYQIFVFTSCFIANCLFLYNRRVFHYILPHIMNEGQLTGMDITLIIMLQQLGFTISTFLAGVLLDTTSAKGLLAIGCFVTGFFNFGFSDIDEPANLMLLAILGGISQGLGWPACVKTIRLWFPQQSFGFWWAMISHSQFLTGLVGPLLANSWANQHGWRTAVQMPAVISMVVAFVLYFCNFDKPSDVGYPDQEFPGEETDAHWTDILGTEFMLLLSGSGFLMTLIRQSSADWGQLYLMEERGISVYNAGYYNAAMELGGAIGTTIIGSMADFAIKKNMHIGYYKYPRMILLFASLFGGGLIMSALILGIDAYSGMMEVNLHAFLMGFTFCAALQNIEALVIETAPPNKFNACYAILNFSNGLAQVFAGFPMSFLAAGYGWGRAFLLLNFSLLVAFFGMVIGKDLDKTFVPVMPKRKMR